jgi:hypothetical protein
LARGQIASGEMIKSTRNNCGFHYAGFSAEGGSGFRCQELMRKS